MLMCRPLRSQRSRTSKSESRRMMSVHRGNRAGSRSLLQLDAHVEAGVATIVVNGDVDLSSCDRLRRLASGLLAMGVTSIELDCANLAFMDSSGLHVIGELISHTDQRGGAVTLLDPNRSLVRFLKISKIAPLIASNAAPRTNPASASRSSRWSTDTARSQIVERQRRTSSRARPKTLVDD